MEENELKIGTKRGCLTVIGELNTYLKDEALERIRHFEEEKQEFIDGIWHQKHNGNIDSVEYFDYLIKTEERRANQLLYKCQCKCGKVHFLTPKLFLSKRHRYCDIISESDASWNTARLRQSSLLSMEHKKWMLENGCGLRAIERETKISKAERIPDKYYDTSLPLRVHETLEILGNGPDRETIIEHKNKLSIRLSKTYRCKCQLCHKEMLFGFEDFDIRNAEYGARAYDGYYSRAKCACHPISSFQWRTIKILIDNGIEYKAEVSFDDLLGAGGKYHLRYDFAIYENGEMRALIECQGKQHYVPFDEFGADQFLWQKKNDDLKRQYALNHGIELIEIPYTLNTISKETGYLLKALGDVGFVL